MDRERQRQKQTTLTDIELTCDTDSRARTGFMHKRLDRHRQTWRRLTNIEREA